MTRIPQHIWLQVDSLPATFAAVWVDKVGRVFVLYHWRVLWAALGWVIAEALAWLECWVTVCASQHQQCSPLLSGDGYWLGTYDGDPRAFALYSRHYSFRSRTGQRNRYLIGGPGEKMVLLTYQCNALFVWRKFIDASGQQGINCAVFRNESGIQASALILEAMDMAWRRWPGERLYTYVNAKAIQSSNPGYCYQMAGWRKCGITKGGLVILECLPQTNARVAA